LAREVSLCKTAWVTLSSPLLLPLLSRWTEGDEAYLMTGGKAKLGALYCTVRGKERQGVGVVVAFCRAATCDALSFCFVLHPPPHCHRAPRGSWSFLSPGWGLGLYTGVEGSWGGG
ncbi:unnamed protein product, partial [Discosporangium mesarthrocarpum]